MKDHDPYKARLRIRACALIVENNTLLLLKQSVPTRQQPIWLPPGGEIAFGESAAIAAQRETREETGLHTEISRLAAIHEFIEPPWHAIELFFLANRTGGILKVGTDPELSPDEQQILECNFVDVDKLADLELYPVFLRKGFIENLSTSTDVVHISKDLN